MESDMVDREMLNPTDAYRYEGREENLSDECLIARAKKDPEAFGDLYDRYYRKIANYIYRRTWNRALTEDLTSNTFYRAFRHIRRFRWKGIPFEAWLFRISSNEIRMHFRKHGRVDVVSLQTEHPSELKLVSALCAEGAPVDEAMALSEAHVHIRQAILALKPNYQTVIALRFLEDKSLEEISAIIGKRNGTTRSLLHRALKQLKTILTARVSEWNERGENL